MGHWVLTAAVGVAVLPLDPHAGDRGATPRPDRERDRLSTALLFPQSGGLRPPPLHRASLRKEGHPAQGLRKECHPVQGLYLLGRESGNNRSLCGPSVSFYTPQTDLPGADPPVASYSPLERVNRSLLAWQPVTHDGAGGTTGPLGAFLPLGRHRKNLLKPAQLCGAFHALRRRGADRRDPGDPCGREPLLLLGAYWASSWRLNGGGKYSN